MKSRRSPAQTRSSSTKAAMQHKPPWRCSTCARSTGPSTEPAPMDQSKQHPFAFPALLIGSSALALGPWLVRLSEVGPVAAGFWRLALALPFLFLIARFAGQPVHWPGRVLGTIIAFAAFFFAADLAAWHTGI